MAVHDVDVVVVYEKVEPEEIRMFVRRGGEVFADVGGFLEDDFA